MQFYRVITGTLEGRTAIHVGSGKDSDITDALVRRDTNGVPVIPGTALAGALRARLTRLSPGLGHKECQALNSRDDPSGDNNDQACSCVVCHLFGDINPPIDLAENGGNEEKSKVASASRLLVFNATPLARGEPSPYSLEFYGGPIRDGVGIERMAGTASRQGAVKFDLEVLPAGTRFSLRMELRDTHEVDELLIAAALSEWEQGRLWLGGRVARGLGGFSLKNVKFVELDLGDPQQLLTFLKEDQPWEHGKDITSRLQQQRLKEARRQVAEAEVPQGEKSAISRRWASIAFTLQVEGFFLTNDATTAAASGFHHAPLLLDQQDWQRPLLGGAALRGALRSHAERIARTLATLQAENLDEFKQRCPACDPNSRSYRDGQGKWVDRELESCDSLLMRREEANGREEEDKPSKLCLACQLFGSPRLGSRLLVEDAPIDGEPVYKMLDFLAVDRFTGGGSEGFKFDALALWRPKFAVRLFLDNPETWELGWLALTLRDLRDGLMPAGFGASKGFGKVKIAPSGWRVRLAFLKDSDFPRGPQGQGEELSQSDAYDGVYRYVECSSDQNAAMHQVWLGLARCWAESFLEKVKEQPRWEEMPISKDTYFGNDTLTELYPKEIPVP